MMLASANKFFEKRSGNTVALMISDEEGTYQICSFAAKQSVDRSGDFFQLKADQSRNWQTQYLDYNEFNVDAFKPPLLAKNANEFFAQLSKNYFSISFPPTPEKRIVKFVKATNGNVLLMKMDNTLIASFPSSQSVVKDLNRPDMFMIQSETAYNINPLVFNYQEVWGEFCEPAIDNSSMDSLLNNLSEYFFFDKDLSAVQKVAITNFPLPEQNKYFKVYDSPQYRGNVYGFTSAVRLPFVVQSVFSVSNTNTMNPWNINHFDNDSGQGIMQQDATEIRPFLMANTFQLNGMYIKVTSTFNYSGGRYHLLRIYQDARTNEIYLLVNSNNDLGTYVPFDFATLKAVDGGFSITCTLFNMTVEIRNKFF